jgi:hypothetical protein
MPWVDVVYGYTLYRTEFTAKDEKIYYQTMMISLISNSKLYKTASTN